ncbi:isovaleryl-CoA dehydrogenase [Massilia antarctica]|uniref:isovaleryl-CoA dehydrogenase n=1 Tax=Massilia antarctica TaxID=2765360 RepID=UPI0006BB5E54|nr:isovaleryl-CoA dehydrogenase [Massilia sp. H27-R4]MCY0910256.1 isovaleryl-CoA dehydrogenase [Massilia sp. H27-R4]CUI09399.1 Acyl-CoA dehydrogenase [Janthinobacterium sp. CG23_2]CUU33185.1 Acyl-CoA dehydrogenase [Janthinobacterium sp. CG23_2]
MNPYDTHDIFNQASEFGNINLYGCDPALQEALAREGAAWAADALHTLGEQLGRAEVLDLARQANVNKPVLHNFDRSGGRIDEVEFHPSWHQLMALMIGAGVHAMPWEAARAGAQVARAAQYMLFGQVENGAQCPVTMTYASVPALRLAGAIGAKWLPKILSRQYDPRSLPIEQKTGALIGMGMTEKQGGTDVRANTTRATALDALDARARFGEEGADAWRIVGHKWFFSAPQSDAHLILAQTDDAGSAGLTCFFVPRYLPDGSRNAIRVQRLKDKLGNRSNASSEVEFCDAVGWPVGKVGRGIPTILEMGGHTRLDCVIGSAGIMRAALTHALHHARERAAFGRKLAEQPLMQNVLADLALESEAATAFALRLARCFDNAADPAEALLGRILTPAGKYWLCKRGPAFGAEAMEVMGGNGYVEDGPLARLYREFPVNSIWEGSGNVMCLDLLRAFGKTPAAREALAAELALAGGANPAFDACAARLLADLDGAQGDEYGARRLAERIVIAVQAALLLRHAPLFVSDAFIASRVAIDVGGAFGRLPAGIDCAAILGRALPA